MTTTEARGRAYLVSRLKPAHGMDAAPYLCSGVYRVVGEMVEERDILRQSMLDGWQLHAAPIPCPGGCVTVGWAFTDSIDTVPVKDLCLTRTAALEALVEKLRKDGEHV